MNTLLEKAKVIRFDTKDTTSIKRNTYCSNKSHDNPLSYGEINNAVERGYIYQHLYFTSDQDIKEGDCYMFMDDSLKIQFEKAKKVESQIPFHNCKKIVASTDKSLDLPKPSEAFIVKYCELGGIDEVDVEYINQVMGYCANCTGTEYVKCDCIDGKRIHNIIPKLNVDNHNTITIHSIKNSWTRKEVENLLHLAMTTASAYGEGIDEAVANDWIKHNLK